MRFLVISLLSIASLVASPKKTAVRPSPWHPKQVKVGKHKGGRLTPRKSGKTGAHRIKK
jgi:hypothetical protein